MRKPRTWGFIACAVLILCAALVALATAGRRYLAQKKLGYCFDVAFDQARNRLCVAAGAAGLHALDVSAGALNYASTYPDGGYARNLHISNGRAYVADTERGLVVLDVKGDPPVRKWELGDVAGWGTHVDGDRAYLAAGEDGLYIFGLTDPDQPELLGRTRTAGATWDVWVHDDHAYVADVDRGLTVVDISSPAHPIRAGFLTWDEVSPYAEIVRGEGDVVHVAAAYHGLIAVDISDPAVPVLASTYSLPPHSWAEGLAVRESLVYLAVGNKRDRQENGLHILDAHDPYAISPIGKLSFPDWVEGVHAVGNVAYVANTFSGARSVDIRNPDNPRPIDSFTLQTWITRHVRSALRFD